MKWEQIRIVTNTLSFLPILICFEYYVSLSKKIFFLIFYVKYVFLLNFTSTIRKIFDGNAAMDESGEICACQPQKVGLGDPN